MKKGKRLLARFVGAKGFSIFVFLFSFFPLVSVPLRGKEGAGPIKHEFLNKILGRRFRPLAG